MTEQKKLIHTISTTNKSLVPILTSVYKAGFFTASQKKYFKKDGRLNSWALDLRIPLSQSNFLQPIANVMLEKLKKESVKQIVGRGYGSYFLIGGMVSSGHGIKAALIRQSQKKYGFRKIIEGYLNPNEPTFIVDDLINTGTTINQVNNILALHNIRPIGAICIFRFAWAKNIIAAPNFKIISLANLEQKNLTRIVPGYFS